MEMLKTGALFALAEKIVALSDAPSTVHQATWRLCLGATVAGGRHLPP
jgi:hypothetical protein